MIWPQNAYVGQRVVTTFEWEPRPHMPNMPKPGVVYTIREVTILKDIVGIRLTELINPAVKWSDLKHPSEAWLQANLFRPVDETRLDIFREMLVKPRVSVDA